MNVLSKLVAVGVVLLAVATGTAGARVQEAPDYSYHSNRDVSNVIVDTSACPGFATSSPLHFGGKLIAAYRHWNSDNTEQGFTFAHLTASDGAHTFHVTQLYLFSPRQFREFVYGFATTRVVRDDHAMMVGASWLGIDPLYPGGGAEGVWWMGTPTCIGA